MNELVLRASENKRNGTDIAAYSRRAATFAQRLINGEASVLRIEAGVDITRVFGFATSLREQILGEVPEARAADAMLRALRVDGLAMIAEAGVPGSPEQKAEALIRLARSHLQSGCRSVGCGRCEFSKLVLSAEERDGAAGGGE